MEIRQRDSLTGQSLTIKNYPAQSVNRVRVTEPALKVLTWPQPERAALQHWNRETGGQLSLKQHNWVGSCCLFLRRRCEESLRSEGER
jgi:hypothetical protein